MLTPAKAIPVPTTCHRSYRKNVRSVCYRAHAVCGGKATRTKWLVVFTIFWPRPIEVQGLRETSLQGKKKLVIVGTVGRMQSIYCITVFYFVLRA